MTDHIALPPTTEEVEKGKQRMSRGLADGPPNTTPTGVVTGGYFFQQPTRADSWDIAHNLGRFPSVTVQTTGELDEAAYVHYPDNDHVVLTFSEPVSGWADLR